MMASEITHGVPAQRWIIAEEINKAERKSAERRLARPKFEADESSVRLARKMNALPPREPLAEFADLRNGGMVEPDRWPSGWWLIPVAIIGASLWGVMAAFAFLGGN